MSVINAVKDYVQKQCPYLDKKGRVHVNYLAETPIEYAIEEVPVEPIIKRYMDGSTIRQFAFVFSSRQAYGNNIRSNLKASEFYERFADWLELQTKSRKMPDLGQDKTAQKLEAITSGYLFDTNGKNAKYQIQCRLIYFQKGSR